MIRGGMISMLHNKTTDIALIDVDPASSLTLMSADIERIVTGMETGHEVRAFSKHIFQVLLEFGWGGCDNGDHLRVLARLKNVRIAAQRKSSFNPTRYSTNSLNTRYGQTQSR